MKKHYLTFYLFLPRFRTLKMPKIKKQESSDSDSAPENMIFQLTPVTVTKIKKEETSDSDIGPNDHLIIS